MSIPIHCAHTRLAAVSELRPHPQNPNKHPDEQIEILAKLIRGNGWRSPIVISKRSGFITKGHGRLAAAKVAGITEVPIDEQDYTSEHDEIADLIADNRISELSEMDQTMVASLMQELDKADFDLSLTAFTENELGAFLEPDKKPDLPEVAFSEQLMEANNYVVVVFRNEIDWLWAQEHFALKSVYSRRPNGKPWSCGIGRVINGADYAKRFHV